MFRGKHSRECSDSEYYIGMVSPGHIEVERMRVVVATLAPSLVDMHRGDTQVAVNARTDSDSIRFD